MGDYDYHRGITFSFAGWELTDADRVTFGGPSFLGVFDRPIERLSGLQPIIFWGGPRASGWLDIRAPG